MMNRTIVTGDRQFLRKILPVLFLMAGLAVFTVLGAAPAHAWTVSGGSYALNNGNTNVTVDEVPSGVGTTTFDFYLVGTFHGDQLTLEGFEGITGLDDTFLEDFKKLAKTTEDDYDSTTEWTEAWLKSADTVAEQVTGDPAFSVDVAADGTFTSASTVANGLYLLKGESQLIENYPNTGDKSYWWPRPMYVLVWNGNVTIQVKPQTEFVNKLTIHKVWTVNSKDQSDSEALARPDFVDAKIYYVKEGTAVADEYLWKTVTLHKDKDGEDGEDWTYSWYTSDYGENANDPSKWQVVEVITDEMEKSYSVTIAPNFVSEDASSAGGTSEDGDTMIKTITNTYDRYSLELTKIMPSLVVNGENNSTSVVFELAGYGSEDSEEPIYEKYVGLQFSKYDEDSLTKTVKDIPRTVKVLKVREVYGGNYVNEDGASEWKTATFDSDSRTFTVEFENTQDDKTFGSGVINKGLLVKNDNELGYETNGSEGLPKSASPR